MTLVCDAAIHLCRVRVTRLDQIGNVSPGPNNVYVTDNPIMLSVKPEIEAGVSKTLVGGCDCIVADYRGYDKLKRFNLELDLATIEPGLLEMITGGPAILDAGAQPIGMWWASQASCSQPAQPNVCVEGWQDLWEVDRQSAIYPYIHWIWPSVHWQIGDYSLQNDFNQPKAMGFTRGNTQWGLGPFGDLPEACHPLGGFFFTNQIPAAQCGYKTQNLT